MGLSLFIPGITAGLVSYGALWAEKRFIWRELKRLGRRVGRVEERVGISREIE